MAQKVCSQAGRFTMPALESIYHRLLEIDEAAKTSRVPLDLALDTLIVEMNLIPIIRKILLILVSSKKPTCAIRGMLIIGPIKVYLNSLNNS